MVDQKKTSFIKRFTMTKLSKKVIGVDVGSKFLTVSFNNSTNQDQVYNIENNQRSILSFFKENILRRLLFRYRSYRELQQQDTSSFFGERF
jgi:transposase